MSVPSLKQFVLLSIKQNIKDIDLIITRNHLKIPIPLCEQVFYFLNEMSTGLSNEEFNIFKSSKIQFNHFKFIGRNQNDIKHLKFLKNHSIKKLSLQLKGKFTLEDLYLRIINTDNLEELYLYHLKDDFKLKSPCLKFFQGLTKFEFEHPNPTNEDFEIICKNLPNLIELSIVDLVDINEILHHDFIFGKLVVEKNPRYFKREYNCQSIIKNLKLLKFIKKLNLQIFCEFNLDDYSNFLFQHDNQLCKFTLRASRSHSVWLKKLKEK